MSVRKTKNWRKLRSRSASSSESRSISYESVVSFGELLSGAGWKSASHYRGWDGQYLREILSGDRPPSRARIPLNKPALNRAHDLAKRITRTQSVREAFECNRRFWDIIFERLSARFSGKCFLRLDDRMTRYYPLLLELYPTPESRPRQREVLIEIYRTGNIAEAFRAFKKIYLQVIDQITDHLKSQEVL